MEQLRTRSKGLIFFNFLCATMLGQNVLGVDTLLKTGPIANRVNLVIMGDGYTSVQMPQFLLDATSVSNYLLNQPPFNEYQNYFNIFAIKCVSPQSGVTHAGVATDVAEPASPITSVTNYFGTCFDNYSIHRLLYTSSSASVYSTLASHFPSYDQVIILSNTTVYGGAGGSYAVSSVHASSKEIVAHEIGHSFANLADEYWAGLSYATEKPNMTATSNPATVKWGQWVGLNNVNVFPHGPSSPENGWFRPHQNCKMRYLNKPFCSVCGQTIIEKIHSLTTPIDASSPVNTTTLVASSPQWFKTKLVQPNPNTLKRTWILNTNVPVNNIDSVLVDPTVLNNGNNTLVFTVIDTTSLSKDLAHATLHSYSIVWSINKNTTGVNEIKPGIEYEIYPNPAADVINVRYNVVEQASLEFGITDLSGKVVARLNKESKTAGEYIKEISVSDLNPGIYFLVITINSQPFNHKFVIYK